MTQVPIAVRLIAAAEEIKVVIVAEAVISALNCGKFISIPFIFGKPVMPTETQFKAIYDEYKQLVYNLALNYLQHTEEAQDITQEVFVKVYQHFEKHDPATASFKTWIYRITINHCLDLIRSRRSKKRFGFISSLFQKESNEPIHEAVHSDHPGIAAEDKEELQQLFAAINELPENQKTVLILVRIEDRPQKEVAEIMNTSVKAVESLLQRAKQTLSKKVKNP